MRLTAGSYLLLRHHRWFFRCRLPLAVARLAGRQEIVRSLGTADGRIARLKAATIGTRLHLLWTKLATVSDRAALDRCIAEWFQAELDRAFRLLGAGEFAAALLPTEATPDERARISREAYAADAQAALDRLEEDFTSHDFVAARPIARAIATAAGQPLPKDGQEFAVLCKRVMDALWKVQDARLRWAEGDVEYKPQPPSMDGKGSLPDISPHQESQDQPQPGRGQAPLLQDAIDAFIELRAKERRATPKAVMQWRAEAGVLTDAFGGDRTVADISEKDAGSILTALRHLPAHWRSHPQLAGLPFFAKADEARKLELPPLDARTINGTLSTIRSFFNEQVIAGNIVSSPFSKAKLKEDNSHKENAEFTNKDIETIFSDSLFARPHKSAVAESAHSQPEWHFWAPLIAFYTGMRVAEIAQLRPADVITENNHPLLWLDPARGMRLKTPSSRRKVPIHTELLRLGLLQLADAQRAQGAMSLLPDCPAPVAGDPGKQLSKWLSGRFLKRVGVEKRPGLGFHAFRHGLKTRLREAGVPQEVSERILGHASPGVGSRYGSYSPELLSDAINKIAIPEVMTRIPARFPAAADR